MSITVYTPRMTYQTGFRLYKNADHELWPWVDFESRNCKLMLAGSERTRTEVIKQNPVSVYKLKSRLCEMLGTIWLRKRYPPRYRNFVKLCRNQRTETFPTDSLKQKIWQFPHFFVEFVALVHLRRLVTSSKSHNTENDNFLMILEIYRIVNETFFLEKLEISDFLWKTSKTMLDVYSIELKNHHKSSIWSLFVDLKIIQWAVDAFLGKIFKNTNFLEKQ